jgi:hypothetical protein
MDVVELHRGASEEFIRRVTAIHPAGVATSAGSTYCGCGTG